MINDIQFTKNFSLYELIESQQARRFSFDEQFNPPESVIRNLESLCKNILQPLRDAINTSITISSGYRCLRVNTSIGGAGNSQHLTGHAADIQCFKTGNELLLKKIATLELPFDQLINEFSYAWVHVSYDKNRMRRQILEATKNPNHKTIYKPMTL